MLWSWKTFIHSYIQKYFWIPNSLILCGPRGFKMWMRKPFNSNKICYVFHIYKSKDDSIDGRKHFERVFISRCFFCSTLIKHYNVAFYGLVYLIFGRCVSSLRIKEVDKRCFTIERVIKMHIFTYLDHLKNANIFTCQN